MGLADVATMRVLPVLALTQLIGWGTVGLLAVIGADVAADLGIGLPTVFAGTSLLYVAMGVLTPLLARPFTRFGARRLMIAGTALAGPGFLLLGLARGPVGYFAAWTLLGVASSATLTTAAHILLSEIAGRAARGAIGALMLVTGLSSSLFWPTTSFLASALGWRGTALAYAALILLVSLPLHLFALPARSPAPEEPGASSAAAPAHGTTFYLIAAAIALNAFVTFGLSAVLIELLKAEGLAPAEAVTFGSMLGVIQIGARAVDLLGGARWDAVATGLVASLALPLAMLILAAGEGSAWAVGAFILLYGVGSGALAVARATIPLVFHDRAAYAVAATRIALPLNLLSALAPPVLAGLLAHAGSHALLGLTTACSCAAFGVLVVLRGRRPGAPGH